ncbi:unnamed protein product, partial [Polarella glacialis]
CFGSGPPVFRPLGEAMSAMSPWLFAQKSVGSLARTGRRGVALCGTELSAALDLRMGALRSVGSLSTHDALGSSSSGGSSSSSSSSPDNGNASSTSSSYGRGFGSFHSSDINAMLKQSEDCYTPPTRPFPVPRAAPKAAGEAGAAIFGEKARAHFRLDENSSQTLFLNHGAFGGSLTVALQSKRHWADYVEQQPVRFVDRELFSQAAHITRRLAKLVQCPPTELLPMPNVTTAMNTILRSWQRREAASVRRGGAPGSPRRFVLFSTTYGSTKILLRQVASETGAEIDEVPLHFPLGPEGLTPALQELERHLSADTALVVIDSIPSNTPVAFPVEEAVAICRRVAPNALVIVDGAHSLGQVDL